MIEAKDRAEEGKNGVDDEEITDQDKDISK
jgi:hypothetical protein